MQNCGLDDSIISNNEEEEINIIKDFPDELKKEKTVSLSSFENLTPPINRKNIDEICIEAEFKENQIQNFKELKKNHPSKSNVPIFFNPIFSSFEKMSQFKNYYPDNNVRQILLQNEEYVEVIKKCKSPTSRTLAIILGNQLKKTNERETPKNIRIYPDDSNLDKANNFTNIFMQKVPSETFFRKSTFVIKLSFFDLVDQVLLNKELRKKLMSMKTKKYAKKKVKF